MEVDAGACCPIMLGVAPPLGNGNCCAASAGRMHAAVGRQGSSSKPAFHEGSVWSSYRLRGVLSEAWSRGCVRVIRLYFNPTSTSVLNPNVKPHQKLNLRPDPDY